MNAIEKLHQVIFPENNLNTYAVVDSVATQEVSNSMFAYNPPAKCLLDDAKENQLEDVAPYLVQLKASDDSFSDWLLKECYGKTMVIFLHSKLSLDDLSNQLSLYTKMALPEGNKYGVPWAYFAFYDPRVFPDFLRSMSLEQTNEFHQGIAEWFCEDVVNSNKLCGYCYDYELFKTQVTTFLLKEA